jgi:hypothetical protein
MNRTESEERLVIYGGSHDYNQDTDRTVDRLPHRFSISRRGFCPEIIPVRLILVGIFSDRVTI